MLSLLNEYKKIEERAKSKYTEIHLVCNQHKHKYYLQFPKSPIEFMIGSKWNSNFEETLSHYE